MKIRSWARDRAGCVALLHSDASEPKNSFDIRARIAARTESIWHYLNIFPVKVVLSAEFIMFLTRVTK